MKSRVVLLLSLCGWLAWACSSPTPEELASLAAKGYYEHLLRGEYELFLDGKAGADSLPEDYREQLIVGYKQFMIQQRKAHASIDGIRVTNAKTDTAQHYTNVFLMFCYGDSTNEEIVVPMVECRGSWRMK